jgi:hypothetical protein
LFKHIPWEDNVIEKINMGLFCIELGIRKDINRCDYYTLQQQIHILSVHCPENRYVQVYYYLHMYKQTLLSSRQNDHYCVHGINPNKFTN